MLVYLCPSCAGRVKAPGQMGRSWCKECESYQVPLREEIEEGEQLDTQINPVYVYTSYTPPASRMQADERPDHRFAFTKRRNRLSKGGTSFWARCTCKKWNDKDKEGEKNWVSSKRLAHIGWEKHMVEIETQQRLPV